MIIKLDLKKVFDDFYAEIDHLHSENDISYVNVLQTTAQTLSGAINELNHDVKNLKDRFYKLISITIPDGQINTANQDYVLIKKISSDFTVSCMITVNTVLRNGLIGLGAIEALPDNNTAINNIAGISVKVKTDSEELFTYLDNFNDDSHISLNKNHEYKLILEKEGDLYTGQIYDITTGNLCIQKSITNVIDFEYIVIWGINSNFNYYNIQLNADYLLKTEDQTIIGAINELYDNQEYILTDCANKINEL